MFVIFDTNIWISDVALNSERGAVVRFYLRQHSATVVVPEVMRLEIEKNLKESLISAARTIKRDHLKLLKIFGSLQEVNLPDEAEIKKRVKEIIPSFDVPKRELPFSLEVARASMLKTITGEPPSGPQNQQFKDGVIWAHCVDLLNEADVYLVTSDKGFYHERKYNGGLSKNLRREVQACKHKVTLFPNLEDLLEDIRQDISLDKSKLVETYLVDRMPSVESILKHSGFQIEDSPEVKILPYATEDSKRLYIDFTIVFRCSDASNQERTDGILELSGDGAYDTSMRKYLELKSKGERLIYTEGDGQQVRENYVLRAEPITIGAKYVKHNPKYSL